MDFDTSFIKIGWKMWKLWVFEYLQMARHVSGHFIGYVTSLSLINYA